MRIALCLIAVSVLTFNACTEGPRRNVPPAVSFEAREIANARPDVSYYVLDRDSEIVTESLPKIGLEFERKGFTRNEAEDATFAGWRELRVNKLSDSDNMTRDMLITYVSEVGKLVIKSSPTEADVHLNGQRLNKPLPPHGRLQGLRRKRKQNGIHYTREIMRYHRGPAD